MNPPTTADIDQLAQEVLEGKWGNGDERKAALGALYDAVQARVNELLAQSGETPDVPQIDVDGYWGEGTTKALQAYFGLTQDGIVAHQWPHRRLQHHCGPSDTHGHLCGRSSRRRLHLHSRDAAQTESRCPLMARLDITPPPVQTGGGGCSFGCDSLWRGQMLERFQLEANYQ